MKLTANGINGNLDGVEVQVSLKDIQAIVRDTSTPRRDGERMVKSTMELAAKAGALSAHTSMALYGNNDIDPALVFLYSKQIIQALAEMAIACGYDLDQIGTTIVKESTVRDDRY